MKICTRCKKEKILSEFYKNKGYKDGLYSECKDCHHERGKKWRSNEQNRLKALEVSKQWYLKNPERHRVASLKSHLKKKYNMTIEEFEALKKEQGNRCLICKKVFILSSQTHIDHDHLTKEVRGILCTRCNFIVGMVEKESDIVMKAVKYVKRNTLKILEQ